MVTLPEPMPSGAKAEGRFGKQDFAYLPDEDVYRCPSGQLLRGIAALLIQINAKLLHRICSGTYFVAIGRIASAPAYLGAIARPGQSMSRPA